MNKLAIIIVLTSVLTLFSCTKKDDPEPIGTEGAIIGRVQLFDEAKNAKNNDGMIVSIYGSNPLISDTTDANGSYHFAHVKYGTYSLVFVKPNYGIFMINNVYHTLETTEVSITPNLGEISTTHIDNINSKDTLGSVFIYISTSPIGTANTPKYLRVFFHTSDMVGYDNFTSYTTVLQSTNNPLEYRLNPHKLEDMGFQSGETVWFKAYGESYYSNAHIEPLKGKHIFPNINLISAAANSFIVP